MQVCFALHVQQDYTLPMHTISYYMYALQYVVSRRMHALYSLCTEKMSSHVQRLEELNTKKRRRDVHSALHHVLFCLVLCTPYQEYLWWSTYCILYTSIIHRCMSSTVAESILLVHALLVRGKLLTLYAESIYKWLVDGCRRHHHHDIFLCRGSVQMQSRGKEEIQ